MVATPISAMAFDDDGKVLYTASNDSLKVWNMAKKGLLIESVESPWKGVQDIRWTPNGLLGVAAGTHYLSVWVFDEKQRINNNNSRKLEKR
jgi:WD40 repeat protein